MSITDNLRLSVKVCQLYYEDNLNQLQISKRLGISRSQISRILTNAKKNGIVSISINNPYSQESAIEKELIQRYGLSDALVFNTNGLSGESALIHFGKFVANQIEVYLADNSLVGVMSGKTISEVVKAIKSLDKKGLEFIPLIGGMGSGGTDWHANIIAQSFAQKSSGEYSVLNAPVLVTNKETRDLLIKEPAISKVLEKGSKCNVNILGIGQVSEKSTSVKAGALTIEEINNLKELGAVGSICASYIDAKGKIIENSITDRSIGQRLEDLGDSKNIGLAIGKSKISSIKAALVGEHIDVLITNMDTAYEILNNKK